MPTIEKRERKNGTTYRALVRLKGYPPRQKTFKRLTDAKLWAQQTEAAIRRGEFHTLAKTSDPKSFSELAHRYRDEVWPTKSEGTSGSERAHLAFWENRLGDYGLSHITSAMITEGMRELGDGNSLATGRPLSKRSQQYYRHTLRFVFKCAIQWGWISHNPWMALRLSRRSTMHACVI